MGTSLIFGNKSISEFFEDLVLKENQVHIDEIYRLCDLAKIKRGTAERKLRHLSSPKNKYATLDPILNIKKVVIGYQSKKLQKNLL